MSTDNCDQLRAPGTVRDPLREPLQGDSGERSYAVLGKGKGNKKMKAAVRTRNSSAFAKKKRAYKSVRIYCNRKVQLEKHSCEPSSFRNALNSKYNKNRT